MNAARATRLMLAVWMVMASVITASASVCSAPCCVDAMSAAPAQQSKAPCHKQMASAEAGHNGMGAMAGNADHRHGQHAAAGTVSGQTAFDSRMHCYSTLKVSDPCTTVKVADKPELQVEQTMAACEVEPGGRTYRHRVATNPSTGPPGAPHTPIYISTQSLLC